MEKHVLTALHRAHSHLVDSEMDLRFAKREVLIKNRISLATDGWLVCAVCVGKKLASYETGIPHIESSAHKRRLAWAVAEDEDPKNADTHSERSVCSSRRSASVSQSGNDVCQRVSNCLRDMRVVNALLRDGEVPTVSIADLSVINEQCDELVKMVRSIRNRAKVIDKQLRLAQAINTDKPGLQCVVCMDAERSRLLLPCRHLAVCHSCEIQLPTRHCPTCRVAIEESVDVFRS